MMGRIQGKLFVDSTIKCSSQTNSTNLVLLTVAGAYADLQQQVLYDLVVFAQIVATTDKAWKVLPNKVVGDQLSKVLQGPSEPFQDYVEWLLQLAGKLFVDTMAAMPIVKQLAFENTNKY